MASVQPGSVIAARFVIDRRAGSGGMGTVYRAFDRVTGEPVALKVLHAGEGAEPERSAREAAILAELHHPAIVRYVAHGVADSGEPWLAMEWLEGEDLAAHLARARLSLEECLLVAERAAAALACAHARGMIHRDIKPSNLFLPGGDPARLKVLDFGIARASGDPCRLTRTGVILGTLGYVAPEQIRREAEIDARADVFALGCVLFECLTGRPAFAGGHPMAVLAKILLEETPGPAAMRPGVPEALDALVRCMLDKDRERRPRDGGDVGALLAGFVALADAASPPSTAPSSRNVPTPSLGLSELRIVSVVLAGDLDEGGGTLRVVPREAPAPDLVRAVEPFGGRVALHAGRAAVITIWSTGDAADRAERAARCALAIHERAPAAPVCVVTGRGQIADRAVGGELIDRGVASLYGVPPGEVRVDEATAAALGPRFLVARGDTGIALAGVRSDAEAEPPLCGRPSPFVGRERELGMLEAMLAGCASEPEAGVVVVTGPCGSGKSRLSRELAARLRAREPRLVTIAGRGDALTAGAPLGMIADAVRRAAGIRDTDPAREQHEKLADRVGQWLPGPRAARVAAFLGELAGAPFPGDGDDALRAARRDPMLMGDSTRAAWEEWLAAECAAGPVLLVLDDLHFGDSATVGLVDTVLRNLRDLPLLCLALARPEVEERFPRLWAERAPHVVRLGPLSRRSAEALVRHALGGVAAADVLARVVEHGGGNPFYLEELARAVAAGRGDAFPASMLDAVEARLDAEGMDAKRVLRAASIFGKVFSRDGVAALTGGAPDEAAACLARLEARELVAPASSRAGSGEYVFRDACVREAAYATLTDEDRALGHRLAGEWLEREGPADAVSMAEHFRRGRAPWRSVPWYLRAAAQALEANELGAAIARAEEGLVCGGSSLAEVGALRLILAEALVWRGELEPAALCGQQAAELLEPGGEPWFRALTQVALAAGKLGDLDRVEALLGPATEAPALPGADGARVVCLGFCASQLLFGGRVEAADRIREELDRLPLASDAQARGIVHQVRAFRASISGDLGGCREGLEAALGAFEEAGDRRNACATRANLGYVHAELGDFERAEEALCAARSAAERMDLADTATFAEHNLGLVLARRGQLDEARRVEQRAVKAFAQQGDRRLLGISQAYLARIAIDAGDLAAAERAAREAVETAASVAPLRPFALAVLARVLLRCGRHEEARAAAGEAHSALAAGEPIGEGEALVALSHAEALHAAGEVEAVPAVLGAARERILAKAARIRDPSARRRFLADVPDNAETLALAAAWAPETDLVGKRETCDD